MRENGFYWVRFAMEWKVAEWLDGVWWMTGDEGPENDDHMFEIDERRIVRPE